MQMTFMGWHVIKPELIIIINNGTYYHFTFLFFSINFYHSMGKFSRRQIDQFSYFFFQEARFDI